jgi:uncharacterized protein (TIGR03083 family)
MPAPLDTLRASVDRLRDLVTPLDERQLLQRAYPVEWTIADVCSHLGSGAVIQQRRLEDAIARRPTPDEFQAPVWDEWNAKDPRAKATDALVADRTYLERLAAVDDEQRANVRIPLGPLQLDFDVFVGFRVNEHVLHTWDIAVALDPNATLPADAIPFVVDNLELIARFTARPTGAERTIRVATAGPDRRFTVDLVADSASFAALTANASDDNVDIALAAEELIRLVYGRLDPAHTWTVAGDPNALDELRRVFPGP